MNYIRIEREEHSVMCFDESIQRGIIFPRKTSTTMVEFKKESAEMVKKLRKGSVVVPLVFEPMFRDNFHPMKQFLKGKSPSVLEKDEVVLELYQFYFDNAIPQICSGNVEYFFLR